ncbi:hypothetical protein FHR90_000005 [Endobacter medicaginis]|uniref:Uncharacterized protein n=2 Tax=Endobacter medicaginis TaxID=1181271 RepID=A0A839UY23_9PROT|nr:hypothetical protein [Endobacter medicaginis]MBB3172199.1 hypothetical protein [Endobacter medicaginis]MCX5476559.1 hypothetical protein [Endobacter medicaginis]
MRNPDFRTPPTMTLQVMLAAGSQAVAASTDAVRRALSASTRGAQADLLFFEAWERSPTLGGIQRIRQLRRANPALAAELRAEIERRPQRTAARS